MNPLQLNDRERYIIDASQIVAIYETKEVDFYYEEKTGETEKRRTGILWWEKYVDVPATKSVPSFKFSLEVQFKHKGYHVVHYGSNEALMLSDKALLIQAMKGPTQ